MALTISRAQYVATYGPTVGDKVRLGDTNLWATIEQDLLTKVMSVNLVAVKVCVMAWLKVALQLAKIQMYWIL